MRTVSFKSVFSVAVVAMVISVGAQHSAAADYKVDPAHTSFVFRIQHAGVGWVYGRFNNVDGQLSIDDVDKHKVSFSITIDAASIDTGVEKRDSHLKSDDFFDVKQYPTITFTSTSVEPTENGWSVTGDLTMHGQTNPVSFELTYGGKTEFPPGTPRVGVSAEFPISRKAFGVGIPKFEGAIGDEVQALISIEAVGAK